MLCPSCSAASLDAYGRCQHCGYSAAPPAQPYAAYYPQPRLITPTAPAGVGLATQILMAIAGLTALIGFGANIWAYGVARTAYRTSGANVDAINAAAGVAGILLLLSLVLALATGIVFIVWFYKSANLSEILSPGRQALSPGWAIGGWFIPLGSLVLPRIVAGGVWRAAIPLAAQPVLRKPRTYLVTWWWLSFIVGQTLLFVAVSPVRGDQSSSLGAVTVAFGFSGIADLCRLTSAVLGILMIRKVTQMQQIRILQGPGSGHPFAGPLVATAPYAAYAEPVQAPFGMPAPLPHLPHLPHQAAPYGPPTGTPYAPAQPAPVSQPAPVRPEPVAENPPVELPSQSPAPAVEQLPATLVEPSEAATEVGLTDAVPSEALPSDAVPEDAVPADKPTAVLPRPQTPDDRGTVVLKAVSNDAPTDDAQDPAPAPAEPRDA
ncbi:hypothetical protein DN069_37710 [Streptacidiphilus pinicola]|uniref:DUF4328 domain-containing protein n=1 Tax=Streptacidiphilus pinicola TaxID=2219663 RepID=A0A2X0IA27_9ACTN|nr:DUF4328 domain-containing protein [Streptacidiphilus pinicola]RAG80513.1 hypothetical protein DN069_37710 [Streptacidiphilus pinicola]